MSSHQEDYDLNAPLSISSTACQRAFNRVLTRPGWRVVEQSAAKFICHAPNRASHFRNAATIEIKISAKSQNLTSVTAHGSCLGFGPLVSAALKSDFADIRKMIEVAVQELQVEAQQMGWLCPTCGEIYAQGTLFCPRDGTPISRACSNCSTNNAPSSRYCEKCGTEL